MPPTRETAPGSAAELPSLDDAKACAHQRVGFRLGDRVHVQRAGVAGIAECQASRRALHRQYQVPAGEDRRQGLNAITLGVQFGADGAILELDNFVQPSVSS